MAPIPQEARALLESDALAHLVTLNPDGSPQVTCIWVGVDGDEIVAGHLFPQQKLRNMERDPRVALSIGGGRRTTWACGSTSSSTAEPESPLAARPSSFSAWRRPTSAPARRFHPCRILRRVG